MSLLDVKSPTDVLAESNPKTPENLLNAEMIFENPVLDRMFNKHGEFNQNCDDVTSDTKNKPSSHDYKNELALKAQVCDTSAAHTADAGQKDQKNKALLAARMNGLRGFNQTTITLQDFSQLKEQVINKISVLGQEINQNKIQAAKIETAVEEKSGDLSETDTEVTVAGEDKFFSAEKVAHVKDNAAQTMAGEQEITAAQEEYSSARARHDSVLKHRGYLETQIDTLQTRLDDLGEEANELKGKLQEYRDFQNYLDSDDVQQKLSDGTLTIEDLQAGGMPADALERFGDKNISERNIIVSARRGISDLTRNAMPAAEGGISSIEAKGSFEMAATDTAPPLSPETPQYIPAPAPTAF
jgi:hypothetical protein